MGLHLYLAYIVSVIRHWSAAYITGLKNENTESSEESVSSSIDTHFVVFFLNGLFSAWSFSASKQLVHLIIIIIIIIIIADDKDLQRI